jgi:hypothetical protein
MTSRREERIPAKLPVRVWGVDMNGMPFMQTAYAVDITRMGARLVDLYCLPEIGEVTLGHAGQKARYKIAWTGSMGGAEAGEVGLRLLETDKNIWGKQLSKAAAAKPEHGNGHGAAAHSSRQSVSVSAPAMAGAAVAAAPIYTRQRMHPRYSAHAATEVLPDGALKPLWARLTKISASGFYAETPSPLVTDTCVNVTLRTLVGEIKAQGMTRSSHPAIGMGIAFVSMRPEDITRLQRFIEQVVRSNDVSFGLGVAMIEPIEQGRTHPVVMAPKAAKKAAPHPAITAERIEKNSRLAARLRTLILELRDLQEAVASADLDRRVARAFENSVTSTHQNAEYLTRWLHSENENKDPYAVIEQINAERVRIAAEQARELLMDIDAQEIEHSTQGFEKLTSAVTALHKRLTNLFKEK